MDVVAPWYRLGEVVPHLHTEMSTYQFYRVAPTGMMHVTTQWHLEEYSLAAVEDQLPAILQGMDVLASRGVDRIILGGVPVAAVMTRPRIITLLRDVERGVGVPCESIMEAQIAAMEYLDVRRVVLVSRWSAELNTAVASYLSEGGIQVIACRYRGRDLATNAVADPAADHRLLLDLGRQALEEEPSAEGVVMPGGLGFVVEAAAQLEREYDVPTFTNVTSAVWSALNSYDGILEHRPRRDYRLLDGLVQD